ncbi:MAG: hypothetical protein ACRBBS_10980 [Thalassovita sp.]
MRFGFSFPSLMVLALAAGCAPLPDLDSQVTPAAKAAPYPALVPLEPLLEGAADSQTTATTAASQNARAAALRARAAQMRAAARQ